MILGVRDLHFLCHECGKQAVWLVASYPQEPKDGNIDLFGVVEHGYCRQHMPKEVLGMFQNGDPGPIAGL